jgi:hypothetical protein
MSQEAELRVDRLAVSVETAEGAAFEPVSSEGFLQVDFAMAPTDARNRPLN